MIEKPVKLCNIRKFLKRTIRKNVSFIEFERFGQNYGHLALTGQVGEGAQRPG